VKAMRGMLTDRCDKLADDLRIEARTLALPSDASRSRLMQRILDDCSLEDE
jgi:hypothetical protein